MKRLISGIVGVRDFFVPLIFFSLANRLG
jgi:hypothetical protein